MLETIATIQTEEWDRIKMKVKQSTLVSILYNTLYRCVVSDFSAPLESTNPKNWEGHIEEAEFVLAVMKAIRDGKKRIVLDIVKP